MFAVMRSGLAGIVAPRLNARRASGEVLEVARVGRRMALLSAGKSGVSGHHTGWFVAGSYPPLL